MLDYCVTLYLFIRAFVTIITTCFLVSRSMFKVSKDLIFVISTSCLLLSNSRDVNEARTLEAEAEARTLEAEAEARTLEAEAEARTLEAKAEAIQFWPSKFNKF